MWIIYLLYSKCRCFAAKWLLSVKGENNSLRQLAYVPQAFMREFISTPLQVRTKKAEQKEGAKKTIIKRMRWATPSGQIPS